MLFQRNRIIPAAMYLVLGVILSTFSAAQETGSITGRLVAEDGSPVVDATVTLVELRQQTTVDSEGRFRFDSLSPGPYFLQIQSAP